MTRNHNEICHICSNFCENSLSFLDFFYLYTTPLPSFSISLLQGNMILNHYVLKEVLSTKINTIKGHWRGEGESSRKG